MLENAAVTKGFENAFTEMENRVFSDIIRRIKATSEVTRSADFQVLKLTEFGISSDDLKKNIKEALKLSNSELDKLYDDVIKSEYSHNVAIYGANYIIPFEENAGLRQLIKAVSAQTKADFKNITGSLGFAVKKNGQMSFLPIAEYYQSALNGAVLDIGGGAFDYNTVLKRVTAELTNSGLRSVDYASGRSNRVAVAARRAVMTGLSQVTAKIADDNAKALGTDDFEVSWHGGARPSHQLWQGRVYSRAELVSVCGLGTGAGLCGWNCGHSYSPFMKGVDTRAYTNEQLDEMNAKENEPRYYKGDEYTAYTASQRQRVLETTMRAQRQKIRLLDAGKAPADEIVNAKIKLRAMEHEYVGFSEKMGLPQQMERVRIEGARLPATPKYSLQKDVDNGGGSGIIEVGRSLGSAAKNYMVLLPDRTFSKITEGTNILKIVAFAGKGTIKPVRVAEYLTEQYGGKAENWQHLRGEAYIDYADTSRCAEVHWFENEEVGRVKFKVKRWRDEG